MELPGRRKRGGPMRDVVNVDMQAVGESRKCRGDGVAEKIDSLWQPSITGTLLEFYY